MNYSNFDQLLNHFNNKIEMIYKILPFSQLYDNSNDKLEWKRNAVFNAIQNNSDNYLTKKPDLKEISEMIIEMKIMVNDIKDLVKQQKQHIICQNNKLENDLKLIGKHCDYLNANIPTFLQNNSKNDKTIEKSNELTKRVNNCNTSKNIVPKVTAKTNEKPSIKSNITTKPNTKPIPEPKVVTKSVKKKVVQKDIKNIPIISFITTEEFASIPQYMLCRLSYEVINRAIADFNRTINAKYKIIANYSNKYSEEDMRKYVSFKEQEFKETENQFFCTINDLKELSDLKVDTTVRKILICLRHCKRIKEIRGNPPKLIRYAVIANELTESQYL